MSMLAIAFPAEAAIPVAQTVVGVAASAVRPLIGVGIFAALLVLFRPLIAGVLRAALLVISPRKSLKARNADRNVQGALMLNRMARELETTQPGLASELRLFACRD